MDDKLEIIMTRYKERLHSLGSVYVRYLQKYIDNGCKTLYCRDKVADFQQFIKGKYFDTCLDEAIADFDKHFNFSIEDIGVGDRLFWNIDEFDCTYPESIPCQVIEIVNDGILTKTNNDVKPFFSKCDFGTDVTKKPLYRIIDRTRGVEGR